MKKKKKKGPGSPPLSSGLKPQVFPFSSVAVRILSAPYCDMRCFYQIAGYIAHEAHLGLSQSSTTLNR